MAQVGWRGPKVGSQLALAALLHIHGVSELSQ